MLSRCVLLFFVLCSNLCLSQTLDSTALRKARLINEIRQSDKIESYCLGFACTVSALCLKVDSLFEISSFNEVITYFDDTSYVLKYYAFEKIASQKDSLAFEKLVSSIVDSTPLVAFFGCVMESQNFNELLIKRYAGFVKFRYFYGGNIGFNHKVYHYGKPSKLRWRKKRRKLIHLLNKHHFDSSQYKYWM